MFKAEGHNVAFARTPFLFSSAHSREYRDKEVLFGNVNCRKGLIFLFALAEVQGGREAVL